MVRVRRPPKRSCSARRLLQITTWPTIGLHRRFEDADASEVTMTNSAQSLNAPEPAPAWKPEDAALPEEAFEALRRSLPEPERRALTRARLELVAQRLKERLSHKPWYRERAESDPGFWNTLAASRFNDV